MKRPAQFAIAILVILIFLWADWKIRGPASTKRQSQVLREFDDVKPIPGATLQKKNLNLKAGLGLVYAAYEIQGRSQTNIENWYRGELEQKNWKFLSVTNHQGSRQTKFCRGGETAMVDVPETPSSTFQFEFQIGWGSSFNCSLLP